MFTLRHVIDGGEWKTKANKENVNKKAANSETDGKHDESWSRTGKCSSLTL